MINKDVLMVLERMAQAFPAWRPSPDTLEMFAFALADVPIDHLRVATLTHMRRSKFPPTIAELRELATGPSGLLTAEEAWAEIRAQVRSVGSYGRPRLSCARSGPAAKRALDAVGGWQVLCATESDQMGVQGAHFMRCYAAVAGKAKQHEELTAAAEALGIGTGERQREPEFHERLANFLRPAGDQSVTDPCTRLDSSLGFNP